jgi:hypothetical protein
MMVGRITRRGDLKEALWPHIEAAPREISEIVDAVFVADFDGRRAARLSGLVREEVQE